MLVYCIIPAYNEAERIDQVIKDVLPLVDVVLVVDDASTDKTGELVKGTGAHLLRHVINRGQGAALRTGTHYALKQGAEIIIHFDADGQFLASDLPALIDPLKNNLADIVFGSRFLGPKNYMPKTKRYLIMPLARLVNRIFLGVRLTDPQSGLRAFNAEAGRRLNWQEDRMAHCSEILGLSIERGLRIKEVPMTVIYHDFGQRLTGGFKIIKDLFFNKLNN